jgi:1-acyl-sn-glycerol-3-phosphate acyltransferase
MLLFRFIFRFILLLIAVFLVLPFVILFIAIAQKINNRVFNKKIINTWSKILCYVFGLKIKAIGKIQKNPVFIVANHVTWLDIPVIHSYKLAGFVAKEEISRWPLLGWIVKSGETLFIARGKHESRRKVLQLIDARLNAGRSIAVFPEGRVTDGSYVSCFHRQLMQAAVETKTPVQAIAIKYYKSNGSRNNNICFVDDESFVGNVFRLLSLPKSTVELNFCDSIETTNLSARELAEVTFNQVAKELAKNDYL